MCLLHLKARGGWGRFGAGAGLAVRKGQGTKHLFSEPSGDSASWLSAGPGSELEERSRRRAACRGAMLLGLGAGVLGDIQEKCLLSVIGFARLWGKLRPAQLRQFAFLDGWRMGAIKALPVATSLAYQPI